MKTTAASLSPPPEGICHKDSEKHLSARHAFAILVNLQIGSGIFASPAQVDTNVPSPGAALLVWLVGGLLSWAGAASYAEFGAALPLNGGTQEYLRYVYGDIAAFLMAWIYIFAVKPSSMAIQCIVLVDSATSAIASADGTTLASWQLKLLAITAQASLVLLNSISTKTTMRLSESFTLFKIATVIMIFLGGIWVLIAHMIDPNSSLGGNTDWYSKNWFHSRPSMSDGVPIEWTNMGSWELLGHYSAAIYAGLWAYDGWDNANFVASEIRNPGRSLPLAIHTAMAVVLGCFELVNIAYYILVPWKLIGSSSAVAVMAAKSLLGYFAGVAISILVAISCAGAVTSNLLAFGRLTVAASQRGYLPKVFGIIGFPSWISWPNRRAHSEGNAPQNSYSNESQPLIAEDSDEDVANIVGENDTAPTPDTESDVPINAMLLNLSLTTIYIATGSFRILLTFVGMAMWIFYVSTAVALIILRFREPGLRRPYRPPLVIPIIFSCVGTAVIIRSAMFAPLPAAAIAGLLVAGSLVGRLRS